MTPDTTQQIKIQFINEVFIEIDRSKKNGGMSIYSDSLRKLDFISSKTVIRFNILGQQN